MKKRTVILGALAAAGVMLAGITTAWGYFTTYARAEGGYSIALENETTIHEEFSSWTKHVTISNEEESEPVFVRARAYCSEFFDLQYEDANGKWTPGEDGYYYYSDAVPAGASTDELLIRIGNVPENVADGYNFNVVVVYESTKVLYDESGAPYADWTKTLDSVRAEGSVEE